MKQKIKSQVYTRILIILALLILSTLIPTLFAQPQLNFCCEKTNNGAWCQNTLEENCDTSVNSLTNQPYRKTATSCQSTSFCKQGCCVDSDEGLCMENTPQIVCDESSGTWNSDKECNIPQCNSGCCILGDQASFVTLTRCKKLSGFFGLETNFQLNIKNEATCILTAHLQDKGACVFELENQRTCRFTTRKECSNLHGPNVTSGVEFHKDFLCSADELATNCGPTTETMCIEGKDEVYFKDSCGNQANIYDSNKIYSKSASYWQKIIPKEESCKANSNNGNAGSESCGNCNYFKGSICSKGNANYGENICTDLNCYDTKNGNNYNNGESWCVYQANVGLGRDVVGSRHFRHVCINGEEIIEPCADFRTEVCIEEKIETSEGDFKEAACRVNRWRDCIDQDEKEDCLNTDKRDCYWLKGMGISGTLGEAIASSSQEATSSQTFSGGSTGGFSGGATGRVIAQETTGVVTEGKGICLPEVPPGLKFWEGSNANSICNLGSSTCTVKYEKGAVTGFDDKPIENKECLEPSWTAKMNNVCTSLGDCGAYLNIANEFTYQGAEWKVGGEKRILTGLLNSVRNKANG